jgi:hypothetical protein
MRITCRKVLAVKTMKYSSMTPETAENVTFIYSRRSTSGSSVRSSQARKATNAAPATSKSR